MTATRFAPFTRGEPVVDSIPRQSRPQVGEVVRRISTRQHVENALENVAAQIGERRGPPEQGIEVVDIPVVHGDRGHDLLRQDVERVARVSAGFDPRLVHRAGDGGARDEIASKFRDDDPAAGSADRVSGATDALHAAGDRRWRLDLYDQVDGSHVDAELE